MIESQRYDEVNKKVFSIQGDVVRLQGDVVIIREQEIPRLNEHLCNMDKGK